MLNFANQGGQRLATDFMAFCQTEMTEELCQEAKNRTITQSKDAFWFELRYGRITASKLYTAAHCKKEFFC